MAVEIVSLQDIGYMIADSQADLTLRQKIFLTIAVPLVRKLQEKETNEKSTASHSLKDRVRQKRREMEMKNL